MSEQRDSAKPAMPEQGADSALPPGEPSKGTPKEVGGREGPDPVRYGDWEKNGRCIDF